MFKILYSQRMQRKHKGSYLIGILEWIKCIYHISANIRKTFLVDKLRDQALDSVNNVAKYIKAQVTFQISVSISSDNGNKSGNAGSYEISSFFDREKFEATL